MLADGGDERVVVDVDAQVDDLDTVRGQDRGDDVLAELVDVVLHGAEHDRGHLLALLALELLGQRLVDLLEDVGGEDELREVVLAVLEPLADDLHAGLHLCEDGHRILPGGELVFDAGDHFGLLQVTQCLGQISRAQCFASFSANVFPTEGRFHIL